MAVSSARPSVGTTATRLFGRERDDHLGRSIAVYNPGPTTVSLGAADVAANTGFDLPSGTTVTVDLDSEEVLYGITASGSQVLHVLQVGA